MAIPQPNLDDRTFADLVTEMRELIPRHCPEWTDHNVSDPGIMLVELFAFLTETLLYRANRIPDATRRRILELLGGSATGDLDELRARVVTELREHWRAVTAADFELLVRRRFPTTVARVRCLPDVAPDGDGDLVGRIGHVSVVVVPWPAPGTDRPTPEPELRDEVHRFLDERRLVTCRHHVVAPRYVTVAVAATVVRRPGTHRTRVEEAAAAALGAFLAPVGESGGEGWPFGRDVHLSEVCAVFEAVAGVEHVERVKLRELVDGDWVERDERVTVPAESLVNFDGRVSVVTALPLS